MRIGISAGMIQNGKSGVAQYVLALTRALLNRPEPPALVLFVLEKDEPLFAFARGQVQLQLVSERFRSAVPNILWHQAQLPAIVRRLRLDVLHVPSYRRMLWPKPCPLLATIHDLAPFYVAGKYDRARMFYGRVVARALAQRQDLIITVSQNTASDVARFFQIPSDRLRVVPNGLDHAQFHPGSRMGARKHAADRWRLDRPFFLYVSRLEHPGKNHLRLIEAFARFKIRTQSSWLLALGGSDWHGADVIHAAAAQSPFREDIRLLGFVPGSELPDLYRAATAMLYPSLFEGFGFPPVEAMAAGSPVLSSRRGALAEVVSEAAGRLDPEDVEQMAEALTRCSTDVAWREQLREAGLANARRFDWSRTAEAVLTCYRQLASSALACRTSASESSPRLPRAPGTPSHQCSSWSAPAE
jgi:glycosyltransferase involved in cell wall biosynthesis